MTINGANVDSAVTLASTAGLAGVIWRIARKRIGEDNMNPKNLPSNIGVSLFVVFVIGGVAAMAALNSPAPMIVLSLVGVYLMFAIKVADQGQRVAVLRLGRYVGLRGPGIFHIIPIIDTMSRFVDQRVRVANVTAESTLTRDTVPVNVDAVIFWLVWNAE